MNISQDDVRRSIDHTLLRTDATAEDIEKLCLEAMNERFAAVCVPPYYIRQCSSLLAEEDVQICTVIGYPRGYNDVAIKIEEIRKSLEDGADEIDAVINIAAIKSADWDYVKREIDTMVTVTNNKDKVFKLIFETPMLTESEIRQLAEYCVDLGVDFAKTGTGTINKPVTLKEVQLLKSVLDGKVEIKASGGINTREKVLSLLDAGASRIGTSSALKIISDV